MQRIATSNNFTKQTGRQLFYRHFDYIMGRTIPQYVEAIQKKIQVNTINDTQYFKILNNDYDIFSSKSQDYMCSRDMEGIS